MTQHKKESFTALEFQPLAYGPPAATCHHTVTAEPRVVTALMSSEVENTDLSLGREREAMSLISPSRAGSVTEMCCESMSNKLIRDLPGAEKKKKCLGSISQEH